MNSFVGWIHVQQTQSEALSNQNRAKMNHTTFNTISFGCGLPVFLVNPANISPDLHAVLIVRIVGRELSHLSSHHCTQHPGDGCSENQTTASHQSQHSTRLFIHNCPRSWTSSSTTTYCTWKFTSQGENMFCIITDLSNTFSLICLLASFHHLVLTTAEHYVAINLFTWVSLKGDKGLTEQQII